MRANSTADLFRAVLQGQSGESVPTLPLGVVGCYAPPWRGGVDAGPVEEGRPCAYCADGHETGQAARGLLSRLCGGALTRPRHTIQKCIFGTAGTTVSRGAGIARFRFG